MTSDQSTSRKRRTAAAAISRMPKDLRDKVSAALRDGATWRGAAEICAEAGRSGVTAQNVTNYRKGAHKRWLLREERLEAVRQESEATAEVVRFYAKNGGSPAEAGLLAAAEIMSQALGGMGAESMKVLIAENPAKLFTLTREMARVAEFLARRKEPEAPEAAADSGGTPPDEDAVRERVVDLVDEALGLGKRKGG